MPLSVNNQYAESILNKQSKVYFCSINLATFVNLKYIYLLKLFFSVDKVYFKYTYSFKSFIKTIIKGIYKNN